MSCTEILMPGSGTEARLSSRTRMGLMKCVGAQKAETFLPGECFLGSYWGLADGEPIERPAEGKPVQRGFFYGKAYFRAE